MVENDALSRLREAAEIALYRAIAHEKSHRLSYKAWARARDLGIALPEADPWLNTWTTNIADTSNRYQGDPVRSELGTASGRERVCQYVWIPVGAGTVTKKKKKQ